MKVLLMILFIISLFILSVLVTKLRITVKYDHKQDNDHLNINLRAWFGLLRYTFDVPLIKIDKDSPSIIVEETSEINGGQVNENVKKFTYAVIKEKIHLIKELLISVVGLHKIVRAFLKHVQVRKLQWHSYAGAGDAATTGTVIGALWAVKSSVIGLLSTYMNMRSLPVYSVTPNFQKAISETSFMCIFEFRVGHAMWAGLKLIRYWNSDNSNLKPQQLLKKIKQSNS